MVINFENWGGEGVFFFLCVVCCVFSLICSLFQAWDADESSDRAGEVSSSRAEEGEQVEGVDIIDFCVLWGGVLFSQLFSYAQLLFPTFTFFTELHSLTMSSSTCVGGGSWVQGIDNEKELFGRVLTSTSDWLLSAVGGAPPGFFRPTIGDKSLFCASSFRLGGGCGGLVNLSFL